MTYVETSLKNLGKYRVYKTQTVAAEGENDGIYGVHLLALGLRETGLRNINNAAGTDRGCFQISDRWHPEWLKAHAGCPVGTWWPEEGKTAYDKGYCPRFSDAVRYAVRLLQDGLEYASDMGVPEKDWVRFALASYNCGLGGARAGWREGNVDKYTTGGDYSKWVLLKVPEIRDWLKAHPNWRYTQ